MELKVINQEGAQVSTVSASDDVFARDYNEALVHQIVVAYRANGRQGTRAQKGRSDVAKSTRKPWRQKGTGRARAGMASSPLWRGGGRIFPNLADENFSQKVNKKMYRAAINTLLSQLVREERLNVVAAGTLDVETPKTKLFANKLKSMSLSKVLIVTEDLTENLFLAARNLPHVLVLDSLQVDPLSLVYFDKVILTEDAVRKFEELTK